MTIFINPFTGTRKTFIISAVACLVVAVLFGGLAAGRTVYAAGGDVEINETNFPDEVFRKYVKSCDSNKDNKLSPDEIKKETDCILRDQGIKNLKGIEYFTALEYLSCPNNQLTELDLSKNKIKYIPNSIQLGINAYILAIIICILATIITLFIINGFNLKTKASFYSILIVLVFVFVIIFLIGKNANIQGFSMESIESIGC